MSPHSNIRGRTLGLACLVMLLTVTTACDGGGGGNATSVPEPIADSCNSVSILENGVCNTFALRIDVRAPTPFEENGLPVSLEVVLFKPLEEGRFIRPDLYQQSARKVFR